MIPCPHPFFCKHRANLSPRAAAILQEGYCQFFSDYTFSQTAILHELFFHKNCRRRRFSSAVFTAYIATVRQCKLFAQTFLDFAVQPFIRRNGCFPNEILICTQKSRGKQKYLLPAAYNACIQTSGGRQSLPPQKLLFFYIQLYKILYNYIKRIIVFLFCREGYARTH